MLTFVGLGLYDERSVTVEGQAVIRAADRVFAERYTSLLGGASVADLEAHHDVDVELRDRDGVEGDPGPILDAAADGDAVFLTAGDPMVATTHVDLRLRAHERGIETRLVHGTSAETAAPGLAGLQSYRFGKATTLPFPGSRGPAVPGSVLETLADNRERGLHTLVFLDIEADEDRYLTASEAAGALAEHHGDALAVAVARAGSPDPGVDADRLSALASRDFGDPLHLLVVPGDLHHLEAEALRAFAGAPAELVDASSDGRSDVLVGRSDASDGAEPTGPGPPPSARPMGAAPDGPAEMGVPDRPTEWFEVARTRHRYLVGTGAGLALAGAVLSAWIAWEWFVRGVSHEVLAVGAGFSFLLGAQLLVLSTLTSLLVDLHERRTGGERWPEE